MSTGMTTTTTAAPMSETHGEVEYRWARAWFARARSCGANKCRGEVAATAVKSCGSRRRTRCGAGTAAIGASCLCVWQLTSLGGTAFCTRCAPRGPCSTKRGNLFVHTHTHTHAGPSVRAGEQRHNLTIPAPLWTTRQAPASRRSPSLLRLINPGPTLRDGRVSAKHFFKTAN